MTKFKHLALASFAVASFAAAIAVCFAVNGAAVGPILPATVALSVACADRWRALISGTEQDYSAPWRRHHLRNIAIGSVAFGFVMPALFPDGSYQTDKWLIYFNAVFLAGGLLLIPMSKLLDRLVQRLARFNMFKD